MDNLFEAVKQEAKTFFNGTNSCHEWEHTERVHSLAMHIGKIEGADLEVVALASILHDIARKEQDESGGKIDHAERGAVLAKEILEKYISPEDLPAQAGKIKNICHCIASHRFRKGGEPQTLEAKILFDADKLDSIGAIGIGRAFSFAGHFGAKVHDINVNLAEGVEYTQDDTAYHEYIVKLAKIKDKVLTNEGKRLAESRHQFMEGFFERINKEVVGEI